LWQKGGDFMKKETGLSFPEENKFGFKVYIPNEQDVEMASIVSGWTSEFGNMLPKTVDQVLGFFKSGDSILIINDQGMLVSHAAITSSYPNNWKEVGTVATNKEFRNMGAASMAVTEVIKLTLKKDGTSKLFALANQFSAKLFEKLGANTMLSTELPQEVWDPCKGCRLFKKPEGGIIFQCCDTPYKLTDILT
jgi:N-acetylglutamate synthase-like GNAT family acetyltransferase